MKQQRSGNRTIFITYGAFLLIWIVMGIAFRVSSINVDETGHSERFLPLPQGNSDTTAIELGVFIDNVYLFDPGNKTFDSNGWIWLKWSETIQQRLKEKELGPEKLIVFANQIDNWDFALEPTDEGLVRLPDGHYYQRFHYSGHFYADRLDFHRFPFQTIRLPLIFELADTLPKFIDVPLTLTMDREGSGIGAYIDITGYQTDGYALSTQLHEYASNMGNPMAAGTKLQVPQARIDVRYQKSPNSTFLSLLLPLITVMTLTLFSPSLSSFAWDVRVGIPPMALLTLIFLQQGYRATIPELPYVSFLDTVYNICYLTNIILFGLFLWSSNELHAASDEDAAAVRARIDRIDRRFQIGLTLFALLGTLANWIAISLRHGAG